MSNVSTARHLILSRKGQSLVQVLISVAIMSTVAMAFATMTVNQQREMLALGQKLGSADLEKLLVASLADGTVCQYVMNTPSSLTFDAKNLPATVALPNSRPLYTSILTGPPAKPGPIAAQIGAQPSGYSNSLTVSAIKLVVLSGSSGQYSANWEVDFDATSLIRPILPVSVSTTLLVDDSAPSASKVLACQTSTAVNLAPIGSIVAWHKSFANTPALPSGWVECNGQKLADPLSKYNGQTIPRLNNGTQDGSTNSGMFLRGGPVSKVMEGDATSAKNLKVAGYKLAVAFSWLGYMSGGWGGAQYGGPAQISSPDPETRPANMSVVWIMRVH